MNKFEVRESVRVKPSEESTLSAGYEGVVTAWCQIKRRYLYLIDERYEFWEHQLEKLVLSQQQSNNP